MKPPIEVAKPCTADWNAMSGDDRKRLCAQCDKHVHNLSALTPGELKSWVAHSDGTECIGYEVRADGTMITAPRFKWLARAFTPLRWALALFMSFIFVGCARRAVYRTGGVPAPVSQPHSKRVPDDRMLPGEPPPVKAQDELKSSPDNTIIMGKPSPKGK